MENKSNELFPAYVEQTLKNAVVLYSPVESNFYACTESLKYYTITTLTEWSAPFKALIIKHGYRLEKGECSDKQYMFYKGILNTSPTIKEAKINFLALFLSETRNFSIYINSLSAEEKEVWRTATRLIYIDNSLFKELTGKTLAVLNRWNFISSIGQNIPKFFSEAAVKDSVSNSYGFRQTTFCIYLPDFFRQLSFPIFHDKTFKPQPLEELPQGEKLRLLTNTEHEITEALPILQSMIVRGILVHNGNGKLQKGIRKKITKQVSFNEFFSGYEFQAQEAMRTDMTLYLAAYLEGLNLGSKVDTAVSIMFSKIGRDPQELLPLFMRHVQGLNMQHVSNVILQGINTSLFGNIKMIGQGWISIEDLIQTLYNRQLSDCSYTLINLSAYNNCNLCNKIDNMIIGISELNESLFVPYVKGVLLMMSSIGMLDVALDDTGTHPQYSYVDALRYIRLTPLGAYQLGLSKEYQPKEEKEKKYFELDENVLILKSVAYGNPYIGIVEDVAQPIGGKRYKLSAETFLKNCKTEMDVERQIALFKQFVSGDFPPIWEDFFKSVQSKCKPLTPITSDYYKLYRVSPSNRELLHLLSTDAVLKPLVIRAEGYLILIRRDNLPKVVDRLKAFGYLL